MGIAQIKKKGLVGGLLFDEVGGPAGEEIRRVTFGVDFLAIQMHVIDAVAAMVVIVVHHVAQESVEVIESAIVGEVRRFETEMPFSDHVGMVAVDLQQFGD